MKANRTHVDEKADTCDATHAVMVDDGHDPHGHLVRLPLLRGEPIAEWPTLELNPMEIKQ